MSLFRRVSTLRLPLPLSRTLSSLALTLADADRKLPAESAADKGSVSVFPYSDGDRESTGPKDEDDEVEAEAGYRMYKRRWIGVVAIIILNIVAGMSLVWFGPIADDTVHKFQFTLDEVNWLGNCINIVYLPAPVIVPWLYGRLGLRKTCWLGAIIFVASGWIRYAGTAHGIGRGGAYALIIIGQILSGVAQPIFQVLIPGYSEKWFNLRQRTTATMLMSISNPIGVAIGQLISPLVGPPNQGLLVLAIIYSASAPCVLLVQDAPPTPPTRAAGQRNPSFMSLVRAMAGREPRDRTTYMTTRQRIDFAVMSLLFGVLVAAISAFSILSSQWLQPYGYSDTISGLMGATLLLVGIVTTAMTAPLFDRVFTNHLAITIKVLCPFLGGAWLALIWAVRAGDTGGLFAIMAIIGATSLTMLPVAIELAVELTRNADGSSAILWASANLFSIIFVLAEGALRSGHRAEPPHNMHGAIIFQGAFVFASVSMIFLVEGKQTRRAADEQAQLARTQSRGHELAGVQRRSLESMKDEKKADNLENPRSPVTVRAVCVDERASESTIMETRISASTAGHSGGGGGW